MGLTNSQAVNLNIVVVGHVDHGKSTIIGRLLADTDSVSHDKIERVREQCRRKALPFEYAFLLDALKDEQEQGITIDAARCFFQSGKRSYTIIDAPGHLEFIKNMITGASRAEAALLVIDANEGIRENSKRHAFLLAMLGIKQVCILINKMDLVDYEEKIYAGIVEQCATFLEKIDITPQYFIPVSGRSGDNITETSSKTDWYAGPTVLEVLELFQTEPLPEQKPLRLPVQGVYLTRNQDPQRIIVGTVASGMIRVDDEIVFYPSGKRSRVRSFEGFNTDPRMAASAGWATGFTIWDQIYIKRGEVAVHLDEAAPRVSARIRANIFWMGREALQLNKQYTLKLGTAKVGVELEAINRVMDSADFECVLKDCVDKYDVAECILRTNRTIAFDTVDKFIDTARFVMIDDYEISGGGIILEALDEKGGKSGQQFVVRGKKCAQMLKRQWRRFITLLPKRTRD